MTPLPGQNIILYARECVIICTGVRRTEDKAEPGSCCCEELRTVLVLFVDFRGILTACCLASACRYNLGL